MDAVTQQELGQRIAGARRDRGWTQAELATRVDLTQTAVSRIESARRLARGAGRLAEAIGVPVLACAGPGSGRCWPSRPAWAGSATGRGPGPLRGPDPDSWMS